jgi:hypothetical protein
VQVINTSTALDLAPRAWEEDRWAAIDELARSIGADVFFDGNGALVIRDEPTLPTRRCGRSTPARTVC